MQSTAEPAAGVPGRAVSDRILMVGGDPDGSSGESGDAGLARLLADQGCAVTVVEDSAAALVAMGGEEFLLVFLNVSGLGQPATRLPALLQRLRGREPAPRIVILTADPTPESAVEALRLRAFDYLQTPVAPSVVEALVHRARLEGESRQRNILLSLQILAPGLVHELRNPLSGILASSQMLVRSMTPKEPTREYIQILREEAQQLERFLARLAEFGRLGASGLAATGDLDLDGLLDRVLAEVKPGCKARRIQLTSRFDPRVPSLRGDPARLAQACAEIVKNALEAIPAAGALTITTRLVPAGNCRLQIADCRFSHSAISNLKSEIPPEGGWVEIEFADTGTGIPDSVRRRVFDPFFSTRPRALGIGLSLAQAIAFAHGGLIRIHSTWGEGTRVILILPTTSARAIGMGCHEHDPHR